MTHLPKNNDPPQEEAAAAAETTLAEFESLVAKLAKPNYIFRLFVAGNTSRSVNAIANFRRICERYLAGRYEIEVIDIYQQPAAIREAQIIAVPTLIKEMPFPSQRFVGDMSNTERILIGLNIK